jgi:hypothetical protein
MIKGEKWVMGGKELQYLFFQGKKAVLLNHILALIMKRRPSAAQCMEAEPSWIAQ